MNRKRQRMEDKTIREGSSDNRDRQEPFQQTSEKLHNIRQKTKQKTKQVKDKGRSILFMLIFSRTVVVMLLVLVQLFALFSMFYWFGNIPFLSYVFSFLGVCGMIYILNGDENPAFKLAWAVPICIFPVFGIALYLFVAVNPGNRGLQKKLDKRIAETEYYVKTEQRVQEKVDRETEGLKSLSYYIQHQNHFPTYDHTKVTFYSLGEEKYEDLIQELERAREYIFLEYFIINDGEIWEGMLDVLKRKAKEGVEVRIMYDGMCALTQLPFHYPEYLESFGLKAKMFAPIKPILSTSQNNRDHRKILVIDGRVAFNGGINLADEYMNKKVRFGHWKDTAVKLEGEAVRSFTIMFLQMWNMTETGSENYEKYLLPQGSYTEFADDQYGYVIPYNDDPTNRLNIAQEVFLDLIGRAQRYVHITTPYLIPDNELITALCFAARRGVDVKLIMPHIPDKRVIFAISRTYYPQLIEAGVQIYEYTPGFVHAKEMISDDEKAIVGTINLDFRSLYEHFECAVYLYRNPAVHDVEADFRRTLEKCQKIDKQFCVDLPIYYKLMGQIGRLFGPLI